MTRLAACVIVAAVPWDRYRQLKRAARVGTVAAGVALAGCGGSGAQSQTASTPAQTGTPTGTPTHAAVAPAVVASGVPYAANLAFDAHGGLWVISAALGPGAPGGVWYVPPGGRPQQVTTGLAAPTALAWVGNSLLVANVTAPPGNGQVTALDDFNGHGFGSRRVLLHGLPIGTHAIGSIVQGPDGRLYTGYGALADHTGPPGRVLSFTLSGSAPVLEATGLRTAFGLAFWGRSLLVTVNGPDQAVSSPDRLFAFEPGGSVVNFGFPGCYGQGGAACAGYPAPLSTFPSHASPEGIAVKGDVAYVADNGSSVVHSPAASEIVRVDLQTGQQTVFWRSPAPHDLVGVAIGPDGDLYATLLVSGQVVRFAL